MNENWYVRLAQERRRELLNEAHHARLLQDAGIRDHVPAALKALGLLLVVLPFAVVLVRALSL